MQIIVKFNLIASKLVECEVFNRDVIRLSILNAYKSELFSILHEINWIYGLFLYFSARKNQNVLCTLSNCWYK